MPPHHAWGAGTVALVAFLLACRPLPLDVEGIVRAELERRGWPATSVLVINRGRVLANVGHRTPPDRDPRDLVYPLGSIGKMFTAAGVHRLAQRGHVDLGARVADYLPDWPPSWNAVRVHQLLGHTSGVADFWFVPAAAALAGDPAARATDLARVMARVPLEFEPGSRFSYSNTAYQAAARIIERRTGLSYDAYLSDEFFTPLGMTSMHHCRGNASEMARAQPVARVAGPWPARPAGSRRGGKLRARWRSLGRGPSPRVRQRSMSGDSPPHGRHGVAGSTRRAMN